MSGPDPEGLGAAVRQALAGRDWREAASLLEEWTRRHPGHAGGWSARAECLLRLGEVGGALGCVRRARSLAPDDARHRQLEDRIRRELAAHPEATIVAGGDGRPPGAPEPTLVEGISGAPRDADATRVEDMPPAGAAPPTAVDGARSVERTAVDGAWATLRERPGGETSRPSPPARPGPAGGWSEGILVDGRYLVRGSRRGGMGEVYFVHDLELGMDIAVKTPLPSALATDAGRQRFLREAEAWVALGLHPNICSAYYVREIDCVPRLFIEYVDGGGLDEWMAGHPAATAAERLDLAIQIAAGMEHAHTVAWQDEEGREHRGLVHRDLKPANVLVGSDGGARVTDFGLVGRDAGGGETAAGPAEGIPPSDSGPPPSERAGERSRTTSIWTTMTMAGRIMGSPVYMPPEQWDGAHFAGRSADVYAFGCILYELLCGGRPFALDPRFQGSDARVVVAAWRQMHCTGTPMDPRSLVPALDDELAGAMLACLAKDPHHRPASFADLGRTLRGAFGRVAGRDYPRPAAAAVVLPADSLNNRGVSFACLGQPQRAERAWREALAADPRHAEAGFNLGLLEWELRGATDHGIAGRMAELRRGDGGDWQRSLLAGRLLICLGSYREALACLEEAAGASENAVEVVRELAFALCASAREAGDAELWRRAAALLEPSDPALAADPALLACCALANREAGEEEMGRRLWAEARACLSDPPGSLDEGAAILVPGAQLVRRLDVPLGRITAVAVAASGREVVFGTDVGAVAVLDPSSGTLRTLRGHGGRVRCVAVASGSGAALSAEEGQPVTRWDLASGDRRGLQAHPGHLSGLAVCRDGRAAAGASSSGALVVWDLASGRRRSVVQAHTGFASSVALSEDGAVAVTGGGDGNLVVTDVAGERVTATLAAHAGGVRAVVTSPDGRLALSGGGDGLCHLWDLDRAAPIATLAGHGAAVTFVALALDGSRALTAAADGTLRQWELPTRRTLKSERTNAAISGGAASADWQVVAAAHGTVLSQYRMREVPRYRPAWAVAHLVTSSEAEDRVRRFQDLLHESRRLLASGELEAAREVVGRARSIPGHERAPEALEAAAEAIAPFPREGLADGWEERVVRHHREAVTAVVAAPTGRRAVSCGRDRELVVWDWSRGAVLRRIPVPAIPLAARLVGGGGLLATADLDASVRLWDLESGVSRLTLEGHQGRIHDLAADPTGRWLLTAGSDGSARLWEVAGGGCRRVLEGHLGQVSACALAPDGRLGATGGDDGSLLLWDLASGGSTGQLDGHGAAVRGLEWSADGRRLLSLGEDAVRLWDIGSGRCLRTVEMEGGPASCATLTADGRFAAIGEPGGAVGVWRLRDRRRLRLFEGHGAAVAAAAFTPDGHRLLTADADGSVRVWYLDWEAEVRAFSDWDEAVRPHLQVFLAQHPPLPGGAPGFSESDVRQLLDDLRHRGLGWIRPEGVRARLEEPAAGKAPRPAPPAPRPGRRITPRTREGLRKGGAGVLGAALVMAPLVVLAVHLWSVRQLHLDSRATRDLRARNLTLLLAPTLTTHSAPCEASRLADYVRDYTEPTDSLQDWSAASHCLVALADPVTVEPLLELARRPVERPSPITGIQIGADPRQVMDGVRKAMSGGLGTAEAVQSMLARMGGPVVHELVTYLDDPAPEVRNTAAGALALSGNAEAADALVHRARDRSVLVRRAVSRQIPNLAVGDTLDLEEVFAVAEAMAGDRDSEVRLHVAESLDVFAGVRSRALARRLVADDNPEVAKAAMHRAL